MPRLDVPLQLAPGLSRDFLLHHQACPTAIDGEDRLLVAVGPQHGRAALFELALAYGRQVRTRPVDRATVERLVERLTTHAERSIELSRIGGTDADAEATTADVRDLVNQPPVIRYVNLLVREAYDASASDIHLEATRHDLVARFRIDGILLPAPDPPPQIQQGVISRLKLLAELDISERRRPQDGRIRVRLEDRELDLRVACIPTVHGESVVLRLLDRGSGPATLDDLGMPVSMRQALQRIVGRPHGMLLVTGPTGSGKTTTLYGALQCRPGDREKIITVEDPVEYELTDVTQVPVQRAAGVTFATALRAILRQDPDVVMIGEMRDTETAEIAVQAAMTGHLVLSTLHTNDALRAMPRLADLGIPPYLIGATLEGVLAQRLVRRICDDCRTTYRPDPPAVATLAPEHAPPPTLERGQGCAACRGTGFRGRVGIFEFLVIDADLRHGIARGMPVEELRMAAEERGFRTMPHDGWAKVQAGLTTIEEVIRVI